MRLLVFVLAAISAACAVPRPSRVIGGEPTPIENYPFMAGMFIAFEESFHLTCGGTLISTTSVVSVAHCFEDAMPSSVRVRLGTDKYTSGGIKHIVSRIIIHPQFDRLLLRNDVLVMRLSNPAVYSDKIYGARIPGPRYDVPAKTVVYAIGWGDTEEGGPHSRVLQHVAVDIIDHQICVERHAYLKTLPGMSEWPDVTPEMLCTGGVPDVRRNSCVGDNGGPVIHNKDVLVGIISWGYGCFDPFFPGVNVRVSNYTDWIYTNSVN